MKYIYNLELICQPPAPEIDEDCPSWNHCADSLDKLAPFVYNIVHEIPGDFYQMKIKTLKLTRFKNSPDSKKKVNGGYGKGFFGWDWCCEFNDEDIQNINGWKIDPKNEKKFIKSLVAHWSQYFKYIDKREKNL